MFLTLSALYNSWGLPLAILLSVPLAVLGALLFVGAAYLVSPEFINNIYMQISLVMLIGLSAKNAILVVEYADQLFFEKNMDLKAATIEAARLRMRPIMMTAFSFILGVMPLPAILWVWLWWAVCCSPRCWAFSSTLLCIIWLPVSASSNASGS